MRCTGKRRVGGRVKIMIVNKDLSRGGWLSLLKILSLPSLSSTFLMVLFLHHRGNVTTFRNHPDPIKYQTTLWAGQEGATKQQRHVDDVLALFSGSPNKSSIAHYEVDNVMKDTCHDFGTNNGGKLCGDKLVRHLMHPPDLDHNRTAQDMVRLLVYFDDFCRQHHLDLVLDSGSLLGSVRNGVVLP